MKSYRNLTAATITVSSALISLILFPLSLLAQTPSPPVESDSSSPDNLPSAEYPNQLKIWLCQQGDKAIAVQAKDTSIWQEIIEGGGWQCAQQLSVTPGGDLTFSCEPEDTIGILTVIWLEGKEGKQQMEDWLGELAKKNLTCTTSSTTQFWE